MLHRGKNNEFSACKNYIPVIVHPHVKTKLKGIMDNKWLFEKDATLFSVMHKVHLSLDGAKNLYFYVKRKDGKYLMVKHGILFI